MRICELCTDQAQIKYAQKEFIGLLKREEEINRGRIDEAGFIFDNCPRDEQIASILNTKLPKKNLFYKCTVDNKIIGAARVTIQNENLHIQHLAAIKGGGVTIIEQIIRDAVQLNKKYVSLCPASGDSFLIAYYKNLGFTEQKGFTGLVRFSDI